MRYRIQIDELLDTVMIVVTERTGSGGYSSSHSRLYVMDAEVARHGGLVEVLSWLAEQVAATTP